MGGSTNIYATWKCYQYFALLIDNATCIISARFIKKKSKIFSNFKDFVILPEKHYNILVYILPTDFAKLNSDVAVQYFSHPDIFWELSIPNAEQQNRLIE